MVLELLIKPKDGTKGIILRDGLTISVIPALASLFLSILSFFFFLKKEDRMTLIEFSAY